MPYLFTLLVAAIAGPALVVALGLLFGAWGLPLAVAAALTHPSSLRFRCASASPSSTRT